MNESNERFVDAPPLSVVADLDVDVDGVPVSVDSTGERLFVEFPTVFSVVRTFRRLPSRERQHLHDLLVGAGLAMEVRVRHRTVAAMGAGVDPGIVSRQLEIDLADLRVCGVLACLGGDVSALVDHVRRFGQYEP